MSGKRSPPLYWTLSTLWSQTGTKVNGYVIPVAYSSLNVCIMYTPDAGAWGPPVLRGECEEVFVFELSGTHELHTVVCTV